MSYKTVKIIIAGLLGVMAAPAFAGDKNAPPAPSSDWQRTAQVIISQTLEDPGALRFMPQTPIRASFLLGKSRWTGWVATMQIQRNDQINAPIVNYACALSTGKKVPERKLFDNYLTPPPKEDFYSLASQLWLKQKYSNKICGTDGKKCMFDEDKAAGDRKADAMADHPITLVKGKAMGKPETYVACQAGTLRS